MKRINFLTVEFVLTFAMATILVSCTKTDNVPNEATQLNSFSMTLNNSLWRPSIVDNDSCTSTFRCDFSKVDDIPFYTIKAYKDAQSRIGAESDNIFQIQIVGVYSIGNYPISDSYGDFNSYARLIINESGNQRIYENSVSSISSFVKIEEMIPMPGSDLVGIRGSFSGTLYNLDNLQDSIEIENCQFEFKKINFSDYCQCGY